MKKVRICSLDEIADGGLRLFKIEGRNFLVFRQGKRVHVYDNKCPHMGFSLFLGEQKGNKLRCGFHGEVFDLESGKPEGRVTKKPLVNVPSILEEEMGGMGVYILE